jgi:hypothetical protein
MAKKDSKVMLPMQLISDNGDDRYLFIKFDQPVRDLAIDDGNSIHVDKDEYLFIQYKAVKRLIQQDICHVI